MLYDRIISAVILIPIVVSIVFFASVIQFAMFAFIICLISSWEWGKLMHFSKNVYSIWMCTMFGLLCSTMIMITQGCLCFNNFYILLGIGSVIIGWWISAFLLVLFYPNSVIFWNKYNFFRFCFGILIILPFFFGILILHQYHCFNDYLHGKWWLFCVLVLIWVNDSTAYIIGKKFGRYKLLYQVSPKKTWEGCIGGVCISTELAWVFSKYITMNINSFYIIFILFVGTILFSVIGDLTESMFKREAGIKDVSNLIPGHGGLLDRIDSLLSSIPVFTILMLLININSIFII